MRATLRRAGELLEEGLALAEDDAAAFDAVAAAYLLPKSTPAETAAPRTAAAAAEVIRLAEAIAPSANVNVISDVAAGAGPYTGRAGHGGSP